MKKFRIGGDFAINAIGNITTLAISMVVVPVYIGQIGSARYGILSIVWLLLGYFGFLDLGLSRASTNLLSRLNNASDTERSKIVLTAVTLNILLGCAGGAVLYTFGAFLIERIISVPAELKAEISDSLPWVAALVPLALVSGVAMGTLEARDRFVAADVLQVAGAAVGQVAPVICAILIAPSLSVVIPVAVISRVFSVLLILGYVVLRNGPWMFVRLDLAIGWRMLSYGGWVTTSSLISPLMQSLDQFVIGFYLGAAAITSYAVPMNLVMRSQIFAAALTRTLFPRMSRLDGSESHAISESALVMLSFGYAAICAPGILLAEPFIAVWIDQSFSQVAGPITRVLLIGGWINGLAFISFCLLQAQRRPDLTAKFHLLEMVPFVLVLWFFTTTFGLMGAAVAWSLRVAIDGALLFVAAKFGRRALLRITPAGACVVGSYCTAEIIPLTFWPALTGALLLGCLIVALALLLDTGFRRTALRIHRRLGVGM